MHFQVACWQEPCLILLVRCGIGIRVFLLGKEMKLEPSEATKMRLCCPARPEAAFPLPPIVQRLLRMVLLSWGLNKHWINCSVWGSPASFLPWTRISFVFFSVWKAFVAASSCRWHRVRDEKVLGWRDVWWILENKKKNEVEMEGSIPIHVILNFFLFSLTAFSTINDWSQVNLGLEGAKCKINKNCKKIVGFASLRAMELLRLEKTSWIINSNH